MRLRAEMSRRPLVIAIVALLAALLLAPIVMLMLAGSAGDAEAPGGPDDAVAAPVDAADVGWVYAPIVFAGRGQTYSLQAGSLADPGPVVDIDVEWVSDPAIQVGRAPAVGPAIGGAVTYVRDDGERSQVRRIGVAPNGPDVRLAELPEIVWSMAVAPDGRDAYLALVDRADPMRDLGVVRLSLDGMARIERVMEPTGGAAAAPDIQPVAFLEVAADVRISVDGRHLTRRICHGQAGCQTDVLDVETGDLTPMPDRAVLGVAGGVVLVHRCGEAGCALEAIDLASGQISDLAAIGPEWTLTVVEGRPIVVFPELVDAGTAVLRALDLRDGSVADVFRVQGSTITLIPVQTNVMMSTPGSHLLIGVSGEDVGAVVGFDLIALPLDGGDPIEMPFPQFRDEFAGVEG
jgi:hypothetical protein